MYKSCKVVVQEFDKQYLRESNVVYTSRLLLINVLWGLLESYTYAFGVKIVFISLEGEI
jgi:hypothetical protein